MGGWRSIIACACVLAAAGGCGGGGRTPATIGPSHPATVEVGKNVVRIPGTSGGDVAAAAVLTQYAPGGESGTATGWILVPDDAWREAMIAAQFAAKPVSAGILPIKRDYIPSGPADVLRRARVTGFPKAQGLQALVLGKAGSDVFLETEHDMDLKATELAASSPEKLAADVVPFSGGWAGRYSSNVVIVSSRSAAYALPGAAWSAFSGDSLAFVSRNSVPRATAALLKQRQKLRLQRPSIYVIGPPSVISAAVVRGLAAYGPVKRVAGHDAVETAVALARYKDRSTGFGWGITKGPASVSLINQRNWQDALGAFTYAAAGPRAPLLLTDRSDRVPPAVTAYLRSLQSAQPNQLYAFGNPGNIASRTLSQLDAYLAPRQ